MLTGSDLRFDIWKETSDHVNWEKYLEYFRREPEFGRQKSEELIRIYSFLRKELGEDYLSKCYRDGRNLVNNWLWSQGSNYSELRWLYKGLKFFKSKGKTSNYDKLCALIRKNEECNQQGVPFLIAGDSLRKAGFEVIFEPMVKFIKKPDLKIINPDTSEIIYGEISRLDDSDLVKNSSEVFHYLFDFFHFTSPLIPFAGKVTGLANRQELEELSRYIIDLKKQALKENTFLVADQKLTKGIMDFAVAHPDKVKEIEKWEKTKRYRGLNEILSLPLEFDYTSRLISKIGTKAKQLPENLPGIIYIPLPAMYLFFGVLEPLKMIDRVQSELMKYSHIIGVCVYAHLGHECEHRKVEFDFNYFERKFIHGNIHQDVLFIINRNFNFDLGTLADTYKKLYDSFGNIFE